MSQEIAMQSTPTNPQRYEQLAASTRARNERRRRFTQLLRAMQNRAQFENAIRTLSPAAA
jgi:hypothetical protein